jgi:periplasmic divalent cation tolerance protein
MRRRSRPRRPTSLIFSRAAFEPELIAATTFAARAPIGCQGRGEGRGLYFARVPRQFSLAIQCRSGNVSEQNQVVMIYTTYPSIVEAETAGRVLVERRLCACVNILPRMVSFYWWQGKVERGDEVVMIIKTRESLAAAVRDAVKQMHSYTTPAILVIPINDVEPDYHAWIIAETTEPTPSTG